MVWLAQMVVCCGAVGCGSTRKLLAVAGIVTGVCAVCCCCVSVECAHMAPDASGLCLSIASRVGDCMLEGHVA